MTRPGSRWARRTVGIVLLLASCSGTMADDGTAAQCPSDLPPSCPTAVPSYQSDVAAIVQRRCLGCHGLGGVEANRLLDTYNHLYAQRGAVLSQVYGCLMPPAEAPQLDTTERQKILTWLVCQAPNN